MPTKRFSRRRDFQFLKPGGREICHSRMKIVETSHCGVSMCFLPAGVFGNPLAPFLLPLPPQKGEGGGAKRRRVWVFHGDVAVLEKMIIFAGIIRKHYYGSVGIPESIYPRFCSD